jgi:hypothetical protein
MLSAHPIGTRIASLIAGMFLIVPCLVAASPLGRGLLMLFVSVSFLAAAALMVAPPLRQFRQRLAYLSSGGGRWPVTRLAPRWDATALLQLVVATIVFAGAMAAVKNVTAHGIGLPLRWLAGGIMFLAFAEMATAGLPLVAGGVGVTVPDLMRSPYLSTSIGEFWAKRWNILTHLLARTYCYQPLARFGMPLALSITFLASAIAHVLLFFMATGQLQMSLICGAFFLVQPLLIGAERWMNVRRWPPIAARAWTLSALALTAPLIVEPTLQALEKSWGAPANVLLPTIGTFGFVIGIALILSLASLASHPVKSRAVPCPPPRA